MHRTHCLRAGSHKRRDNRCAIAAPKLEHTFTAALERAGWEVHTQVEDPSLSGPPLEALTGTAEDKHAELEKRLKDVAEQKRVLIVRNSHMGGHKFAGNVIVRPQPLCGKLAVEDSRASFWMADQHATGRVRLVWPGHAA